MLVCLVKSSAHKSASSKKEVEELQFGLSLTPSSRVTILAFGIAPVAVFAILGLVWLVSHQFSLVCFSKKSCHRQPDLAQYQYLYPTTASFNTVIALPPMYTLRHICILWLLLGNQ